MWFVPTEDVPNQLLNECRRALPAASDGRDRRTCHRLGVDSGMTPKATVFSLDDGARHRGLLEESRHRRTFEDRTHHPVEVRRSAAVAIDEVLRDGEIRFTPEHKPLELRTANRGARRPHTTSERRGHPATVRPHTAGKRDGHVTAGAARIARRTPPDDQRFARLGTRPPLQ